MTTAEEIREKLRADEVTYQATKAAYEAAIASRELGIRQAHTNGLSVREIGGEIGVSFGLIGRIVRRKSQLAPAAS